MNRPGAIIGASALIVALTAGTVIALDIFPLGDRRPSSSPAETEGPVRRPIDPHDLLWAWTAPAPFDDARPMVTQFLLQAGSLADEGQPLVALEVPWVIAVDDIGRVPAVSAPAAGSIVYASDDGRTSKVERLRIADGALPEEIAVVPEAVLALETAPDGGRAYLAIVERDGRDAGVIELSLDGSGGWREIMPPAGVAAGGGNVVLAAAVRLSVQLRVSLDGTHLLRHACAAAGCSTEVVDLRTGGIVNVGAGSYLGIAGGSLYRHECDLPPCRIAEVDISSGDARVVMEVPSVAALVAVDGRAAIVSQDGVERLDEAPAIRTTDPGTGVQRVVGRLRAGQRVQAFGDGLPNDVRVTSPDGVVLISRSDGRDVLSNLAIDLVSGEAIEVPSPLLVPPLDGLNG